MSKATSTTDQRLEAIEKRFGQVVKNQGEIASVLKDVVKQVYKNAEYGDVEEYEVSDKMPPMEDEEAVMPEEELMLAEDSDDEVDTMDKGDHSDEDDTMDKGRMKKEDDMFEQDEAEESILEMAKRIKSRRAQELKARSKARQSKKGYAATATMTVDEEDSPFGEQQDSIEGNEPQPAGEMGGDREDETFNMRFSKEITRPEMQGFMREVRGLRGDLRGNYKIARAMVPPSGQVRKGRVKSEESQLEDGGMNVEIEKQVKSMSYRDINRMRVETGELSSVGF